jgi:TPR repeat protein
VRWFRLAAEQGYARAQASLGLMYDTGEGVTQDDVQAHMWFNLVASRAAGRAREMAVEDRDLVAGRMTADQLADAQRLAREWDAAHPREPH